MVDRNLIRDFNVSDEELEAELGELFSQTSDVAHDHMDELYEETAQNYGSNDVLQGTIIRVDDDEVLVDVGYKSEGIVPLDEWDESEEPPKADDKIEVILEDIEDSFGLILLSKRKADRIREWDTVIAKHQEGDIIIGKVVRKIKGGLLVNIGVNVFLPASQVDIRRPHEIAEFIDKEIECVVLKIDEERRNIVVSRRKLIEDKRAELEANLLESLEVGQLRKGMVKNIADFGAFVDLGGIDGLLHITDMSWGRIDHPSRLVKIDDEIEVMILSIDTEKRKIALGLKQKTESPWENIDTKYPVESTVQGEVVNVMTYGAFIKLEDGIEGLVHISEMSWTRRINHPSDLVSIGDEVDVVVLNINVDKQEISLGMKQTQTNPWDNILERYPEGANVKGTVRNLTNYGAFIELEEGIDGLLHVSDMSWTRKVSHASELLEKGSEVECKILSVDQERRRIALGLKQLAEDPWETTIPENFQPGNIVKGKVTKITNFGVFVRLDDELEGLLHISELSDEKINSPEDVVSVGDELEVRILRVDTADRKIGLSKKLEATAEELAVENTGTTSGGGQQAAAPREELKGGMGGNSGPLFSIGSEEKAEAAPVATEEAAPEEAEEASTEEPAEEADSPEEE